MNKCALIFVMIVSPARLFAQTEYFPQGTEWVGLFGGIDGDFNNHLVVCGDTTIAGEDYKSVYTVYVSGGDTIMFYEFGIRQQDQVVFRRKNDVSPTELLYDFSLETGDSISFTPLYAAQVTLHVDSTDMVMIEGQLRKTLYFAPYQSVGLIEVWYEGIGCSIGFQYSGYSQFSSIDTYRAMCCMRIDGIDYFNSSWANCNCESSMSQFCELNIPSAIDEQFIDFNILPNPVDAILRLEGLKNRNFELEIYDLSGSLILSRTSTYQVDLSSLKPAAYVARVLVDGMLVHNQLLIKK